MMDAVLLRPWRADDRYALVALLSRVDRTYLSSRLADPFTEEAAQNWLDNVAQKEGRRGVYRAILRENQVVGCIYAEMQDFPEGARDSTLSCFLARESCGLGLGGRALRELTALAFAQLPVLRLTAWICAPHLPSCRMAERAGYTREALLRQAAAHGEENWDLCIYGKLRTEQEET